MGVIAKYLLNLENNLPWDFELVDSSQQVGPGVLLYGIGDFLRLLLELQEIWNFNIFMINWE